MATETISWPTDFPELKKLDLLLKCGICYDYMNTCMMTSCSHNYCSLCIRKFMQYKTQCPTCFEETHEVNLRNNRPLDEVILIYSNIRDRLLRAIRLAAVKVSGSVKESPKVESNSITPNATPKSQPHNFFSPSTANSTPKSGIVTPKTSLVQHLKNPSISCRLFPEDPDGANEPTEIATDIKIPKMFHSPKKGLGTQSKPSKPKELTVCPVCEVEIPSKNINIHLDACLARSNPDAPVKTNLKPVKREPLPKRLYTLMSDKDLKKHLKEYGLNTQGERKTLISRIQRFTVLYNAESDSMKPRPNSELILQVEREEREEKRPNLLMKSFQSRIVVDRKAPPEVIEKANKKYLDENKDSFKQLIENMKQREGRNIKPLKPMRRIESDDEGEGIKLVGGTSEVDPNMPSTSGVGEEPSRDTDSIYSQETIVGEDSDSDFEMSPARVRKKVEKDKKIDWNKTHCDSDLDKRKKKKTKGMSESLYEQVFNEHPLPIEEEHCPDSSYESIFDVSKSSVKKTLNSSTPIRKNNTNEELSERNDRSNSPEMFDESFIDEEGITEIIPKESENINGHTEEVFQGFPDDDDEAVLEKGRRRSKRKTVPKEEKVQNNDGNIRRQGLRKRAKTSVTDS